MIPNLPTLIPYDTTQCHLPVDELLDPLISEVSLFIIEKLVKLVFIILNNKKTS